LETDSYEKNIFTDALESGIERAQVLSPVKFALDVRRRDISWFCERYGEIFDAVDNLPGDSNQIIEEIYQLHWRYATEVVDVMRSVDSEYWERKANSELPDTCLVMLGSSTFRAPKQATAETAEELTQKLRECPVSASKPFEDICEEVLTFLFCSDLPPECALDKPIRQSETDQGYHRRDLLFRNRATEGFWAYTKNKYDAAGIVVDAKNYPDEINSDQVRDLSKYLSDYGVGRLGILVARKAPSDITSAASAKDRLSSAVNEQKDQWKSNKKMIVILDEKDLIKMLQMKMVGQDPVSLLDDKIFTLQSRM
jgi:hypothetical protein